MALVVTTDNSISLTKKFILNQDDVARHVPAKYLFQYCQKTAQHTMSRISTFLPLRPMAFDRLSHSVRDEDGFF